MADTAKTTEVTEATKAPETSTNDTQEQEKKASEKKATKKDEGKDTAKTTEVKKVYKFTSQNKYLTVGAVGIQFTNGTAQTDNIEVAKVLAKIDGVSLVEE